MAWIELKVKMGPAPNAVEPTWVNLDQVTKIIFVEPVPNIISTTCAVVYLPSNDQKGLVIYDPDDIRLLQVHLLSNKA